MAGKMFDSGTIQPKGFIEYVAANLSPGNYTFYTTTDPTVTAQIVILKNNIFLFSSIITWYQKYFLLILSYFGMD